MNYLNRCFLLRSKLSLRVHQIRAWLRKADWQNLKWLESIGPFVFLLKTHMKSRVDPALLNELGIFITLIKSFQLWATDGLPTTNYGVSHEFLYRLQLKFCWSVICIRAWLPITSYVSDDYELPLFHRGSSWQPLKLFFMRNFQNVLIE